jgi:hypothetical protein
MAGGRPTHNEEALKERITIRVTKEQLERIEKLADFCELPKTRMAHNLLIIGLQQSETLKAGGFMHIAKGIVKSSEFIKSFSESHHAAMKKGTIAV